MEGMNFFGQITSKLMDKSFDVGANVIQSDLIGRHQDARQLEMFRKAPLAQMEGYRAAGINPFATESTPSSSPNVSTPISPIGGADLSQYMLADSQRKLNESQAHRNDVQNEETQANIKLLEENAGLSHAEAVNANAQLRVIQETADKLSADIALVREQLKTEGFKQRNLDSSSNLMNEQQRNVAEQTGNLILDRPRIVAEGRISQYNFQQILPLTARKLEMDLHLQGYERQKLAQEVAKLANDVALGEIDLQVATVQLAGKLRTVKAKSEEEAIEAEHHLRSTKGSYYDFGDNAGVIREAVQILGLLMSDLADCVPVGKVLGLDKIGKGK